LVVVDTPNAAAYNIRVDGVYWRGFNPFHIYLFTIPNLRTLLEQHGLVVEQSFSYNNVPTDRDPPPLARRARLTLTETARSMGVMGPAAKAYFAAMHVLNRRRGGGTNITALLDRAVRRAQREPPYLQTEDAREVLARDATGDNIILVARRRQ
jgi:hypothetical protein